MTGLGGIPAVTTTVLRALKIGFAVSVAAFSVAPAVAATDAAIVRETALRSAGKVAAPLAALAPLGQTRAGSAARKTRQNKNLEQPS